MTVYEKYPGQFSSRGSSLGFVDISLWESVIGAKMTRMGKQAHRSQGAYHYGDLWKFLYEGLPDGTVKFGKTITTLGDDLTRPVVEGVEYDAVVIADGGWSSLRKLVTGDDKQPEYAGHLIYRAKLKMEDFPGFYAEGGYQNGKYFVMMLQVARDNGEQFIMGGVAIGAPESIARRPSDGASRHGDAFTEPEKIPDWFLPCVREAFKIQGDGQVVKWLELAATKGKITEQPLFEYKADEVAKGRVFVIGDAAHMASPRTAAGAHTGVLDAAGIHEAFSKHRSDIDAAIQAYAVGGRKRAADLYARSKQVSAPLVYRPGDDIDRWRNSKEL